jgi:hypothetical protein
MADQRDDGQVDDHRRGSAPPALRHGIYAETLLPGENAAEFEELHRALIAEFDPSGAFEKDIVGTMARLIWRKQNLAAFRDESSDPYDTYLMSSLALEDRMDGLLDKCLKRLLFVRGAKSISSASGPESSSRLLVPTKAA